MILSASRRTDIPAFYGDWMVERLKNRIIQIRNPFNRRQITQIEFDPGSIEAIVFWTKNPTSFLSKLSEISAMGYDYYFLFTVNHYPQWERNLPPLAQRLNMFKRLSDQIGPDRVIWRYDPVVISTDYSPEKHLEIFSELANSLGEYTTRCITSYLTPYKKTIRNMDSAILYNPGADILESLFLRLYQSALSEGIELQSCSTGDSLNSIPNGACIDSKLIKKLSGRDVGVFQKDKNQRKNCLCVKSIDVGAYDTCVHQCAYCYATRNHLKASENHKKHQANSPMLLGNRDAEKDSLTKKYFNPGLPNF